MKAMHHLHYSALASGLLFAACLVPAEAQIPWASEQFSRQNKFEVYGIGQYLHQDDVEYNGFYGTTKLHLNDTGLGGFGMAFHINDFLAVHGDFMLGPANFIATEPNFPSYQLGSDAFISSGRFNLDYNILNRRLTPFLTTGIGYQYWSVDQGYYYPYYHYHYYSETDFTWNVGAGIRWNITDNLFIKLTGGAQWVLYSEADNIPTQIEGFFAIGGTFP